MGWIIELSKEIEEWEETLNDKDAGAFHSAADRLEKLGNKAKMPLSRALDDGLFELRFRMGKVSQRITYVFEPEKHIITLTTFHKQRGNERKEIKRARQAQKSRTKFLQAKKGEEK